MWMMLLHLHFNKKSDYEMMRLKKCLKFLWTKLKSGPYMWEKSSDWPDLGPNCLQRLSADDT